MAKGKNSPKKRKRVQAEATIVQIHNVTVTAPDAEEQYMTAHVGPIEEPLMAPIVPRKRNRAKLVTFIVVAAIVLWIAYFAVSTFGSP